MIRARFLCWLLLRARAHLSRSQGCSAPSPIFARMLQSPIAPFLHASEPHCPIFACYRAPLPYFCVLGRKPHFCAQARQSHSPIFACMLSSPQPHFCMHVTEPNRPIFARMLQSPIALIFACMLQSPIFAHMIQSPIALFLHAFYRTQLPHFCTQASEPHFCMHAREHHSPLAPLFNANQYVCTWNGSHTPIFVGILGEPEGW